MATGSWKPCVSSAFAYPLGLHIAESAESLIRASREGSRLRVISPVIDDPGIISLLIDARRRGVIVKCLTSLTDSRKGVVTKGWDETQDLPAHHEAIRTLAKEGVLLRSPSTTPHAKLLHLEGEAAWFGSANLTRNSLHGSAIETAVIIEDLRAIESFRDAFENAWHASRFTMMNHAGAVSLREYRPNETPQGMQRQQVWDIDGSCRLLVSHPGGTPAISRAISETIEHATEEVILSSMSLYCTNDIPLLGEALERCLSRGVKLCCIVRPEQFKAEDYPDPATFMLIQFGMKLLGVKGLHAKGFLIDGKWCGIQSANFNPYSLNPECETANVEFCLFGTDNNPLFSEWTAMIRYLADHPTHQFLSGV